MSELHDEWCAQRVAKILAKRGVAPAVDLTDGAYDVFVSDEEPNEESSEESADEEE